MNTILLIIIVLALFPLSLLMQKIDVLKKKHITFYTAIVVLTLGYLVINHMMEGGENLYFLLFLVLIGATNLHMLYKKVAIRV